MMPMRRFRVVDYDNGWQTVNLDGPPTHEHEIHDMLHVESLGGRRWRPSEPGSRACAPRGASPAANTARPSRRCAAQFGDAADFAWIDIEDDADALGDLDIENFPTLLIADAGGARFFGPVMPQAPTAERLIRGALAGELGRRHGDPALVEHVRALVAEPARRPTPGISLQPG